MTNRKKPGVAFWATVVVVAAAIYVLSIGPAIWATGHFVVSEDADVAMHRFYRPVFLICQKTDGYGLLWWYVGLWTGPIEPVATP